jgi:hypothetical protein
MRSHFPELDDLLKQDGSLSTSPVTTPQDGNLLVGAELDEQHN